MSLAIEHRPERVSMSAVCRALGLNRSSVLRRRTGLVGSTVETRSRKQALQPRALSAEERDEVRRLLRSGTCRYVSTSYGQVIG